MNKQENLAHTHLGTVRKPWISDLFRASQWCFRAGQWFLPSFFLQKHLGFKLFVHFVSDTVKNRVNLLFSYLFFVGYICLVCTSLSLQTAKLG